MAKYIINLLHINIAYFMTIINCFNQTTLFSFLFSDVYARSILFKRFRIETVITENFGNTNFFTVYHAELI